MLDLSFCNAKTLGPEGWHDLPVSVSGGLFVATEQEKQVDLTGFLLLPGAVDLHGDAFEKHIAPRRGAVRNIQLGFAGIEAELAANGITTAFLAQFFSWEGGIRGPRFAYELLAAHAMFRSLGTDLCIQLRFETHMINDYHRIADWVARFGIRYLAFNDHLPHKALMQGKRPPKLTGQALRAGRSPEAHLSMMQALHHDGRPQVKNAIEALMPKIGGISVCSHDDATAQDRAFWRGLGVNICEFPETLETAQAAKANGDHVVMGAPNAMRGGSHNRNVSVHELVRHALVDALASDYHYPSMRLAVQRMIHDGVCDLSQGWRLISSGPAALMGMKDRGEIEVGRRADFVICREEDMSILCTVAAGRITHMSGEVAQRFIRA